MDQICLISTMITKRIIQHPSDLHLAKAKKNQRRFSYSALIIGKSVILTNIG